MKYNLSQRTTSTTRVRRLVTAAFFALVCAVGPANYAATQVASPSVPNTIAVPKGNSAYLIGRAIGTQGYTCLSTSTGGAAWNPTARPEATLFTDLFGRQFQIITLFQSIKANPKPNVAVPLSGNATWQSSLDSSRMWAAKSNGIDPSPNIASSHNTGSIQCLLLQSVGNKNGPSGGNLLTKTTFIQRLNTSGGAVPTAACTVVQTQLVPYPADYFFYGADKR